MEKIKLPLDKLLLKLEKEGFYLDHHTRLRLQKTLHAFGPELAQQPEKLKAVLSPILAKNQLEQERFYQCFDEYYQEIIASPPEADRETLPQRSTSLGDLLALALSILLVFIVSFWTSEPKPQPQASHEDKSLDSLELAPKPQPVPLAPSDSHQEAVQNQEIKIELNKFARAGETLKIYNKTLHREQWDFIWNFGTSSKRDVNLTNNASTVEHTYFKAGTYHIQLTARHKHTHEEKIITQRVYVDYDGKPILAIEPQKVYAGDTVIFSDYSPFAEESFLTIHGEPYPTTVQFLGAHRSYQYVYEQPGYYAVELKVFQKGEVLRRRASIEVLDKKTTPPLVINTTQEASQDQLLSSAEQEALEEVQNNTYRFFTARFYLFCLGTFVLIWGLIELALQVYRRGSRSNPVAISSANHLASLSQFPKESPFLVDKSIYTAAQALKKRKITTTSKLNMKASIRATSQKGGLPQLLFAHQPQSREYLILIDRSVRHRQQTRWFEHLIDLLKKEEVAIEKYYFERLPNVWYTSPTSEGRAADTLMGQYQHHTLLIFAEGEAWVNADSSQWQEWAKNFLEHWPEKVWMSPKLLTEWGTTERVLESLCPLLPAHEAGQSLLVEALTESQPRNFWELKENLEKALQGEAMGSIDSDRKELTKAHTAANTSFDLEQLTYYLEDTNKPFTTNQAIYLEKSPLVAWVCALAVYPYPNWTMTVEIGQKIQAKLGLKVLVNSENLLKLSSLPWFNEPRLPEHIEQALLRELSQMPPEIEQAAREAVLEVIEREEKKAEKNTSQSRHWQVQRTIQEALLDPVDRQAWRKLRKWSDLKWIDSEVLNRSIQERFRWRYYLPWLRLAVGLLVGFALLPQSPENTVFADSWSQTLGLIELEIDETPTPQAAKIIEYDANYKIHTLDPIRVQTQEEKEIVGLVYETPMTLDEGGGLVASLFSKVEQHEGVWTFWLAPGTYFHDHPAFFQGRGREINAQDFKYSFKRLIEAKIDDPKVQRLQGLLHDFEYAFILHHEQAFKMQFAENISKEEMMELFSLPQTSVVASEVVDWHKADFSKYAVGTGDYKLDFWQRDYHQRYVLVKKEESSEELREIACGFSEGQTHSYSGWVFYLMFWGGILAIGALFLVFTRAISAF